MNTASTLTGGTTPSAPTRRRVLTVGAGAGLAAALLPASPASAAAAAAGSARHRRSGSLVLVGGGLKDENAQVYGEIVRRAGGDKARIGVLTCASVPPSQDPDAGTKDASNSEANGAFYADLLRSYGAGHVEWVPVDLDRVAAADDPHLAATVASFTGFFFGGGDQYRYVTCLMRGPSQQDSAVLAAIRGAFARGAVVAGTSAGAQIQAGRDMVTGGESYQGVRDGSRPGYFDDSTVLGYLPLGGFGFFRSGLLDTHFTAYGREGRSVRLAADTGHDRVFGLDPDTALVVDAAGTPHERLSVLGSRGVNVMDLRRASTGRRGGSWSIDGVRWSRLTSGDRYDPRTWRTRPAADTRPLVPVDRPLTVPLTDAFSSPKGDGGDYRLLDVADDLLVSAQASRVTATTYEDAPRYAVTLRETRATRARVRDGADAATPVAFADLELAVGRA